MFFLYTYFQTFLLHFTCNVLKFEKNSAHKIEIRSVSFGNLEYFGNFMSCFCICAVINIYLAFFFLKVIILVYTENNKNKIMLHNRCKDRTLKDFVTNIFSDILLTFR